VPLDLGEPRRKLSRLAASSTTQAASTTPRISLPLRAEMPRLRSLRVRVTTVMEVLESRDNVFNFCLKYGALNCDEA